MPHPADPAPDAGPGDTLDATLSIPEASVLSILLAPAVVAIFVVPYALLWGINPMIGVLGLVRVLAAIVVGVVIHEGLHALGFLVFGRARPAEIQVGIIWYLLTPYAHCKAPMRASAYRAAVLLPGVALGVIPALAGVAVGAPLLVLFGVVMTIAALGDALVVWAIRGVPGKTRVIDHPSKVGCRVIVE
jgi:hypothetical protein